MQKVAFFCSPKVGLKYPKSRKVRNRQRNRISVEMHVSTMRRLQSLPEPCLHIARHMPDGPSCKKCSCHIQAHTRKPRACGAPKYQTARKLKEDQSPGRAGKRHKRQHPPNAQTPATKHTDNQLSDRLLLPPRPPGITKHRQAPFGRPRRRDNSMEAKRTQRSIA